MLGEQDRHAFVALDVAQHRDQLVDLRGPQSCHHLVEEEQARTRGERPRDLEASPIGERQTRGGHGRLAGQAETFQHGGRTRARPSDGAFFVKRAHHRVLQNRQAREGLDQLKRAADAGRADSVRPTGPRSTGRPAGCRRGPACAPPQSG